MHAQELLFELLLQANSSLSWKNKFNVIYNPEFVRCAKAKASTQRLTVPILDYVPANL